MARRKIWLAVVLVVVPVFGLLPMLFVPSLRHAVLLKAGEALTHSDALDHADAIVIAVDGGAPEVLEATDLVKAGLAGKVWVFSEPLDAIGLEFQRRGMPYYDRSRVAVQTLHALGVRDAELIEPPVDGSNQEVTRLIGWCREQKFNRVIFIAVADHSRRIRRMLDRDVSHEQIDIRVRYSRYSPFRADSWWRTRDGIRTEIIESEKLVLDVVQHP